MSLTLSEVASAMMEQNTEGFKLSGKRRVGKLFNDRAVTLVQKQLPFGTQGYAQTALGRFVIANLISAAIVKFGYTNEKLVLLAEAGVLDATDNALDALNIEGIVSDLIDGIDTSGLTKAADTGREATADGLRRASEFVDTKKAV